MTGYTYSHYDDDDTLVPRADGGFDTLGDLRSEFAEPPEVHRSRDGYDAPEEDDEEGESE